MVSRALPEQRHFLLFWGGGELLPSSSVFWLVGCPACVWGPRQCWENFFLEATLSITQGIFLMALRNPTQVGPRPRPGQAVPSSMFFLQLICMVTILDSCRPWASAPFLKSLSLASPHLRTLQPTQIPEALSARVAKTTALLSPQTLRVNKHIAIWQDWRDGAEAVMGKAQGSVLEAHIATCGIGAPTLISTFILQNSNAARSG